MKSQALATPSVALFACLACLAQGPVPPKFDVASIKPAAGGMRPDVKTEPGSLTIRNQSLLYLIQWAYDTQPFEIEAPAWLNDSRFDVLAKAEGGGDDAKLRLMLQALLAERFGLKAHTEQKEMQVYGLTVAKGGPKFQESADDGPDSSQGQMDVMSILFTALQQQLGVKLESKKENVDVLVIDHAEKTPTEK